MKYAKCTVQNFKGIQNLEFDLDGRNPLAKVFTLVGLNESGKTTILEALSFFNDNITDEKEVTLTKAIVDDIHELIPKNKKDNFNESIILTASIKIEPSDKKAIKEFLIQKGIEVVQFDETVQMIIKFNFKDSAYIDKTITWTQFVKVFGKKQGSEKRSELGLFNANKEVWFELIKHVKINFLPSIIYYPNFLFDFPDKIFLEPDKNEDKEQIFYRSVIQDILNSLERGLTINDHIVKRVKTNEKKDIEAIESVVNKMSGQVTRFLTKSNFNVFSKLLENKEILIKYPKQDSEGKIYLEIKLKHRDDEYYIRERSLGIRWFFTFMLFTLFRTSRDTNKQVIFLFDEPASNLHQTGQHRLLQALDELTKKHTCFSYLFNT